MIKNITVNRGDKKRTTEQVESVSDDSEMLVIYVSSCSFVRQKRRVSVRNFSSCIPDFFDKQKKLGMQQSSNNK